MRKLKAALIVLLAVMLSLCLFACRDKNKDEKVISRISRVSGIPTLTDSDTQDSWNEKVSAKIKVNVKYEELSDGELPEDETLTGADVKTEIVGIDWSDPQLGDYKLVITPAVHNANKVTEETTISLEHDFGAAENGVETCKACGARRTSRDEHVQLKYQDFHSGYSAQGAVFNNKLEGETYSYDENADSAFKKFGYVTVWNGDEEYSAEVPTVTVGRLEKGSTISVTGTAVEELDGSAEQYWFFPIIGIADRNANGTNPNYPESAYKGGTSVIMRNDGHILYNGIGQGEYSASSGPFSGAKLAALAGGDSEDGFPNYGSGTRANSSSDVSWPDDWPAGYGQLGVLPDVSAWPDWYVYSTNDGSIRSPGPYASETDVVLTWTYRNDGVIEMTISATEGEYVYKGYVKVPDSPSGYYETILHGERTRYTFSKSSIVETRTAEDVRVDSNEKTYYYENEMFDASALKISYQYDSGWESATVSADMVEGKLNDNWVTLDKTPLSSAMTGFRLNIVKGSFNKIVDLKGNNLPVVIPNAIGTANGNNYKGDANLLNNDKVGSFALSVEHGTDDYIVLTPALAAGSYNWAQKIADTENWTNGTPSANHRYVVVRLDAGTYGTFTNETVEVKSGTENVPYKLSVENEGKVAYLALALTKELAANPIVVKGVNSTPVKIDLTALRGFDATSELSGKLGLTSSSEITVTYHVAAGTDESRLTFAVNNAEVGLSQIATGTAGRPGSFGYDVKKDVSKLASEGTFSVTVTFNAPTNLTSDAPLTTHVIGLKLDGEPVAQDVPSYDFDAKGEYGGFFVQYTARNYIYFIKGEADADMQAGDISGSITVNINAGGEDYSNVRPLELSYGYSTRSGVRFTNVVDGDVATISTKMIGTVGDPSDVDSGYIVILRINVNELGVRNGNQGSADYYFEVVGESEAPNLKFYKVSGTADKTTTTPIDKTVTDADKILLREGDCLTESGLVAYVIKEGDNVIFYAGATLIGGGHTWEGTTCERCGATLSTDVTITSSDNTNCEQQLQDGEYVELTGTYNNTVHAAAYNGIETNVWQGAGSVYRVRVRNDGYYERLQGGDNQVVLLYNSTPYNTANGVLNGIDGQAINTEAGGDYNTAKRDGKIKVVAYFVGGTTRVVTVTTSLWTKDQDVSETPYFSYTVQMKVGGMANSVLIRFRMDTNGANVGFVEGSAKLVHGKIAQSAIGDVTASANVTAKIGENAEAAFSSAKINKVEKGAYTSAYVEGELPAYNPSLVLHGVASKLEAAQKTALGITDEYDHYVSFKTALTAAPAGKTTVRLIDLSTGEECGHGYVKLDGTDLEVVIPFEQSTLYKLDFANDLADMHQGDVVIDLTQVSLADVTMEASSTATILGGEATLTVTGEIPEGAKLVLGESSLNWSEIAEGSELGGLTVKSIEGQTVTFTVPAADLSNAVTGYDLHLRTASDGFLADASFDALDLPAAAEGITLIEGVYVKAEGNTLLLVTDGANKGSTKQLVINANGGSATVGTNYDLIGNYNISVKIDANGAPSFESASNNITKNSTLVWSGIGSKTLLVIKLDLTDINVEAATAYGFQLSVGGVEMGTDLYVVKADRTISKATLSGGESSPLKTSDCNTTGLAAKLYEGDGVSFYYDVEVTPAHHYQVAQNGDGAYVCETCGAVLYAPHVENGFQIKAATLGVEDATDLYESGLTVNFFLESTGNDWDGIAVWTAFGKLKISLPILQANNQGTDVSSDATIAALRNKLDSKNLTPGDSATPSNDATWDTYSANGANTYVTITISSADGVTFYKNGAKQWQFLAATTFGNGTVEDFVHAFLLASAKDGGIVVAVPEPAYGGSIHANSILVETKAYTEAEVQARYETYLLEADAYPVHEHEFSKTTDACDGCGLFNPDHGDTQKGGLAHNWGEDDHCTFPQCGILNPDHGDTQKGGKDHVDAHGANGEGEPDGYCDICGKALNHTHTFVDGVCSDCHYVCTHTFTTSDGDCTECKQYTGKQISSEELGSGTNGWTEHSKMYTMNKPDGGKTLEVVYSAKFDTNATLADYTGVVTRFYDGGTEQAFLQGNCFSLNNDTNPWGSGANADRTLAAYLAASKAGFTCRVIVRWTGDNVTVIYEVWTAADDTTLGPDKTGTVTFTGVATKSTYNVFFGLDGVESSNAKLVVTEYSAKA